MATGKFVAYYRVSTVQQGASGLGLDAQRAAVLSYLNGNGWALAAEFTEVESGRKADRPQLTAALIACRQHKATLVIAKLDRLARNVAFVSNLMEAGVEFVACDFPQANRLTVHILAAVAEHEREMISKRTKEALAAAKARGAKLGNPNPRPAAAKATAAHLAGVPKRRAARLARVMPHIQELQAQGPTSNRQLARDLNGKGVPGPRGGIWHPQSVTRLLRIAPPKG